MADDFDPYYTWLGIPPEEQPADHYRLLGVRKYESNADVITNAMDQRMHYLRSLQVGKRSALSQKILNEVSSAGVVLLDPSKRTEYDRQLKAKETKAAATGGSATVTSAATVVPTKTTKALPVATSLPQAAPLPASPAAAPQPAGVVVSGLPGGRSARHGHKSSLGSSPVVLGGAAFVGVAVLGLVGLIVVRSLPKPPDPPPSVRSTDPLAGKGKSSGPQNGELPSAVVPGTATNNNGSGPTPGTNNPGTAAVAEPPKKWWDDEAVRRRLFALRLEGPAHAEMFNTGALVDPSKPFTVEAWVKVDFSQDGFADVLGTHLGGRSAMGRPGTRLVPGGWGIMLHRDGRAATPQIQWVVDYWDSGSKSPRLRWKVSTNVPGESPEGAWTHLAVVHEPSRELTMFVNGFSAARVPTVPNLIGNQRDLRLGANPNFIPPAGISIQICGLRISTKARYAANFAPPSPLDLASDADTAAALDFQQPLADTVKDLHVGSHHAKLGGATWLALDPGVKLPFAAPPPSVAQQPPRIDLIQQSFDGRQQIRGDVTRDGSAIRTGSEPTAFMLPMEFPEEYLLEADVVRESGEDSICIGFPIPGGRRMTAIVDGQKGTKSGLSAINEQQIFTANNPFVKNGRQMTNGTLAKIQISVNKAAVELSVDGASVAKWSVNSSDKVLLAKGMGYTNPKAMAIFTWSSPIRISRLEMIAVPSSSGPAAPNPPLAAGSPIELIDAARKDIRAVQGSFQVTGSELTTGTSRSRLIFDGAELPDEFTLDANVTRLEGQDTLWFGFPVQGRPLSVLIDGWTSSRSGICVIPGQDPSAPGGATIQMGPLLSSGKTHHVRIVVSKQEVRFDLDESTIARWPNDPAAELQAFGGCEPEGRKLALGAADTSYRIAKLKLTPGSTASSAPGSPPMPSFAEATKKAPIPDAAAKAKAMTQIAAVFGDELKGAKLPPAKSKVARDIVNSARDTTDLAVKYVMYEEARRLFVEIKEIGPALATADAIAQDFDVPPFPVKVKLLESMAEGSPSAPQRADLVSEACSLGFEAIDSDQFELAQALAAVARNAASRASPDVKAEAKEFTDEFAQRHKRWDAVKKAEKTLAATPDDKGANQALGLYYVFERSDLAKGLPLLVKGSDPKLVAAANARLNAKGLGASLAEADAWFDCLATAPADYKAAIQKRALDAYELALPSVEGLDKAKVAKRRDQLKADLAATTQSPAAAKRGKRIRKGDLPESSPGMVGRVFLGGKDSGLLVTFNASSQPMDTQKLRNLLTEAKVLGGRIVLEGVLTCPTSMSMRVRHRGASSNFNQQILINGQNLSNVGGSWGSYDNEPLQLGPGVHRVQWIINFDGSVGPEMHIYEDSGGRTVPLTFNRDQNYGARKLPTTGELDLTDSRFGP